MLLCRRDHSRVIDFGLDEAQEQITEPSGIESKAGKLGGKIKDSHAGRRVVGVDQFRFYKKVSKLLYRLDKLAYDTVQLAEKERDMEIAGIATLLESAQKELAPYKTGKGEGIQSAFSSVEAKISDAIAITEQILLRDKEYKSRKKQDS